ncbi:MAG: hypothetical protein RIF32_24225 [Leptospirales bacterium]|jgi:hypothetical protein
MRRESNENDGEAQSGAGAESKKLRSIWVRFGGRRLLIAGGVLLGSLLAVGLYLWPLGMPAGHEYFRPVGERSLQSDEEGQWNYVQHLYRHMEATGDTFPDWDAGMMSRWKYAIAFLAYGMPSLALIEPEKKELATYYLYIMINKMKSKKVWREWQDYGFGEDPICLHNVMYKGHLNLMYGLYQFMSGDERFAKEFTWLTRQIVAEIDLHSKKGLYEGSNCEPDQYFVQCNAISLLSLHLYDRLYGTDYTGDHVQRVLGFIRRRMTDPKTGLYWHQYHPSHDVVETSLSGYTNAWSMVMLNYFEPEYNARVYPAWKDVFVVELGPYAYVKEEPGGGASQLATAYGMLAAKEFGDVELFTKLRNSMDRFGGLSRVAENDSMAYTAGDNTIANGMLLAFKLHVGWERILESGGGPKRLARIPAVENMVWTDLLPDEIHESYIPPTPIQNF